MPLLRIGHRGAKGHIAENTIESINKALELEVDGIEIDIFKCLSGELVLSHYNSLKKLCGKSGNIEDLTINQLQEFLIDNKFKIPTLQSALNQLKKPILVNIELKGLNTYLSTSLIIKDLLSKEIWSEENFLISSFRWEEVKKFQYSIKNIPVGLIVPNSKTINEAIEFAKKINAQSIHPNYKHLNRKIVKKIKKNGFKVFAWTVNKKDDINIIKKMNVDGIISDYPDRI
jgi:glycerophosphoryl diester phosphodiesterase